jgi:multidrug efflux system membrane fusion protein
MYLDLFLYLKRTGICMVNFHCSVRSGRGALIRGGLCLLLIGPLLACSRAPAPVTAVTQVAFERVQGLRPADEQPVPAQLQARHVSDLGFRVPGKIIEHRVHVGDLVRKGQILARLDAADARQQQLSARAALQAAEHRLTFARQQWLRDKAQLQQELISRVQMEQSEDNFAAAEAARRQAEAQLSQQGNQLQYNLLVADHDGLITADHAEAGTVVAAGQAVFTLAWTPDLDVILDVSTRQLAQWTRGQAARLQVSELPGLTLQARVREIAGHEDNLSGSYRIRLSVLTPDARLRPGMLASVSPASDKGRATLISASALFHRGSQAAVWVIRPDTLRLELRPVSVTEYRSNQVLVSSGLQEGERIVLAGVHNVYQGQLVKPVDPPSAALNDLDAQEQS